tara:strand:+ start:4190 stop:6148 length:1959 start_codon:yes stop_codon:yes gene_type:complete
MANWKKVIVSGSVAELSQITASKGLNFLSGSVAHGNASNYLLTLPNDSSGSVEVVNPAQLGSAFSTMSVASNKSLLDQYATTEFGHTDIHATAGLNQLIFVSGSNIEIQTSASIADKIGYIKISAVTQSVIGTVHQVHISHSINDNEIILSTPQDISTGSNVAFGTVSASGDITAANLNIAGDITHIDDNTKITFTPDTIGFNTAGGEKVRINSIGNVGIGTTTPNEKLTVKGNISASGHITASGNLSIGGDTTLGGDLGIGGTIFSLTGFGVTIDDVAITSGSVNFGSGSNPGITNHKFTGSVHITGSTLKLTDGVFEGDGELISNISASNITDVQLLTWGGGLTSSYGSAYGITSSIKLRVETSGSEITASSNGLYIPSGTIRIDHFASAPKAGDILTWSGSAKTPITISVGPAGTVLTSNGAGETASFAVLPVATALGVQSGSYLVDTGNGVDLIATSSAGNIISSITFSGSANAIDVSSSLDFGDNTIHLRLADNVVVDQSISTSHLTASALRVNGDITASGDLFVGGNFQVAGTTTLLHTSNVLVEDAFLTLASGSTSTDGGIVIQDGAESGRGFGWDNTIGRWGIQDNLHHTASNLTPTEWMITAKVTGSNPLVSTSPSYGQSGEKISSGQMWVNTGSGDIWIYVD